MGVKTGGWKNGCLASFHGGPVGAIDSMKALVFLILLGSGFFAVAAEKPNLVVILADDMGFSDLGCYGSEIPTPHLDALAASGVRFSQFYNTGRCCPTRASLLTGLYSHRAGIGHMTEDKGLPGYRGFLTENTVTLGEVLKPAGYFTAVTGKWHVGHKGLEQLPLQRGFDRFYGVPEGGGFYFKLKEGRTLWLNDQVLHTPENNMPDGWYSTDAWTEWGLKFIDEARLEKKPFLLYLAHNAPHFPLQAPAAEIEKFRQQYRLGWGAVRDRRHERLIELGMIDRRWAKAARPETVRAWQKVPEAERDRFDHLMAVYAACVHRLDQSVGQLVAGLKQRGVFENTVIWFMSDNGGTAESGPAGRSEGDPSTADSTWFCGESWAFVQNTPFRLFKRYNHEGGIATPLIVHWPKGLAGAGKIVTTPAHVIDVMATCLDLAGAQYPLERAGKAVTPLAGKSLRVLWEKPEAEVPAELAERALFWEHEGRAAVRQGDFKLVRQSLEASWELYEMKTDRTESRNLVGEKPEVAARLEATWQDWAEVNQVLPAPGKGAGAGKGKGKGKNKAGGK
jgi:arylsulfatase A-like enzyme